MYELAKLRKCPLFCLILIYQKLNRKDTKNHIILKKPDRSCFDLEYLYAQMDIIFGDVQKAKENLPCIELSCIVFLKDDEGQFHEASAGFNVKDPISSTGHASISHSDVQEYFDLTLEHVGREVKFQLDSQLEFI